MQIQIEVINAFSVDGRGGNPAGVVLDADTIPADVRQKIAARAGFPETAFVSRSRDAALRLEFFTPLRQIAHCGHATIATFSYLKQAGKIIGNQSSKETIDGTRQIRFVGDKAFMEQSAPHIEPFGEIEALLASLRIPSSDLASVDAPAVVNTGNSFLIVPIRDESTLARIDYARELVAQLSARHQLIGLYLYAPSARFDATARMFAPYYGIDEEAGTGMAAGPLACYLWQKDPARNTAFRIEQGRLMPAPSPSLIHVDLEISEGRITRVFAGGAAHRSTTLMLDLPG